MGSAEKYFSQMKAQKFTYPKIVNIHLSQPLCGCLCVGAHVWFNIFAGSVSFSYSVPNNASQAFFMKVSNFGLFSTLLFHRSTVINFVSHITLLMNCIILHIRNSDNTMGLCTVGFFWLEEGFVVLGLEFRVFALARQVT
jgi:hypothetical protein